MEKLLFRKGLLLIILHFFFVCYVPAQDLWDGSIATSFHGGSGTEDDPYQIRTGAELMYFVSQINAGNNFAGKTVKLMNDIDMYGNAFYANKQFSGVFDGGSHYLTLGFNTRWIKFESGKDANEFPVNQCPVLFDKVNGHIHHLGILGRLVSASRNYGLSSMAIVNNLTEDGVINDCYYRMRCNFASASGYLAAIAIYNNGNICNCFVEGATYRYDNMVSESRMSGLVYQNNESGIIRNCYYYNKELGVENYNYGAGSIIYDGFYGNSIYIGNKYEWNAGALSNDSFHCIYVKLPLARINDGVIENSTTNEENPYDEYISILNQWVDQNPSHDHWCNEGKKLESFNSGEDCLVEFIDTKFNLVFDSKIVNTGEVIGVLPTTDADWTLVGWTRLGYLVDSEYIVNTNMTLFAKWEQQIRKQPTEDDMSVEVDDASHASFQWYRYLSGETQMLDDWQSTNHGGDSKSTKTFTITAKVGCKLEFDYDVSCEEYDTFSAYLNMEGVSNSSITLVRESGEKNGHINHRFEEDGVYVLTLSYSKDEDTSEGKDMVSVTNIKISDKVEELGTDPILSKDAMNKKGLYYCKINYSNTGVCLTSDIIPINNLHITTNYNNIEHNLQISVQGGALYVFSDSETTLRIYSIDGNVYRILNIHQGMNRTEGLYPGAYLINNKKLIIR